MWQEKNMVRQYGQNKMKNIKGSAGNVQMNQSIESILRLALNWEQVNGIVINPFGKYIQMTKKMIELLINGYEYNENERKSKDDENN